jgi:hypothetical protein
VMPRRPPLLPGVCTVSPHDLRFAVLREIPMPDAHEVFKKRNC